MISWYDWLFRQFGTSILDLGSSYRAWLEDLRKSQFLPPEEFTRCQEERLRRLCEYAFRNVPLFKKLGGTTDFEDVAELPILSKKVLRGNLHLATSRGLDRIFRRRGFTSGTTGVPFTFWTDRRSNGLRLASRYIFDEWIDLSFGGRTARIILHPNRLARLLANELQVSHACVNSKTAPRVLERILRFQPQCLISPPYAFGLLAEANSKIRNRFPNSLRSMVATGDDLLDPQRILIEKSFDCKLYNRYGLMEISGYVAQECKAQRGLHVNVEHVLLETVDDMNVLVQGSPGRIVITDLHNRVMPLIRYDTGDIGILSTKPCTCGITWPLLQVIQGRERDYVDLKDGARTHLGIVADDFLEHFSGKIFQLQFVQRKQGSMTIRMIPRKELTYWDTAAVHAYFTKFFSSFDLEFLQDLPSDQSGKRPLLVRETDDRTSLS